MADFNIGDVIFRSSVKKVLIWFYLYESRD
jgi:hypothetical protein